MQRQPLRPVLNNNRCSLSLRKSWDLSLPRSAHLHYPRAAYCESLHLIFQADLIGRRPMDDRHSAPATESLPLLRNESNPRPYQAYCITEASRPPTPDVPTPKPLRIRTPLATPLAEQRESEPRQSTINSIVKALAIKFEQGCITTCQVERDKEHGRGIPPNENPRSGNTSLEIDDHIVQAVTPRGSHPLMTTESTVCDRTPSHLRMQQSSPTYVALSPTYRCKPLPHHANIATMEHRPLPPLPLEPILNAGVYDLISERVLCQSPTPSRRGDQQNKTPYTSFDPENGGLQATSSPSRYLDRDPTETLRSGNTSEAEVSYTDLRSLQADGFSQRCCPAAQQDEALLGVTQLPSAEELYNPHGLLADMEETRRAHRRTRPKDAKFRYLFGSRPPVRLDNPPPEPPHRPAPILTSIPQSNNVSDQPSTDTYFFAPQPSSTPAKVDTQAGPRPPPWVSTDNLEMRRQMRSDAREREDARKYRLTTDSGSSTYKGSDSTDSLRENTMRREVEEYREQVLRIYPDLEFDGRAGEGRRRRWCCVVM
jgi:hypothetical protein